jgi:hypothetical protein
MLGCLPQGCHGIEPCWLCVQLTLPLGYLSCPLNLRPKLTFHPESFSFLGCFMPSYRIVKAHSFSSLQLQSFESRQAKPRREIAQQRTTYSQMFDHIFLSKSFPLTAELCTSHPFLSFCLSSILYCVLPEETRENKSKCETSENPPQRLQQTVLDTGQ